MNNQKVNQAKKIFLEMFHDEMSEEAIEVARNITSLNELDDESQAISAGEFDAIEAAYSNR